jgi:hypothetical protein
MSRLGEAVIVTHNSEDWIASCAEAALRYCEGAVVVDNGSRDGTLDSASRVPSLRIIANQSNLGFAAAVNQGIRETKSDYVLILNPDTILQDEPQALFEELARPEVGAAAGVLISDQGEIQKGFTVRRFPTPWSLSFEALGINRVWPSNPVNERYRCMTIDYSCPQDVEQPAGAFLAIKKEAWARAGGFDERFHPVWFEDVDFLKRLSQLGYRIRLVPQVRARHAGGHSVAQLSAGSRRGYWYGSLLKYAAKHFGPWSRRVVAGCVAVGAASRCLAGVVAKRSETSSGPTESALEGYSRVIRLAVRQFWAGQAVG